MSPKKILIYLTTLMFFMFGGNFLTTKFYWYYSIWWFDIVMHFLGGFWVGLFFVFLFLRKGNIPKFVYIIFLSLFIGVLWEAFEFWMHNIIAGIPFSITDPLSDILFDLVGACLAVFYFSKFIMPREENKI